MAGLSLGACHHQTCLNRPHLPFLGKLPFGVYGGIGVMVIGSLSHMEPSSASTAPSSFWVVANAAAILTATLFGGSGAIVPLEDVVRESGYLLTPALFSIGALWTFYTSWLMVKLAVLTGESSYTSIACQTLGHWGGCTVSCVLVLYAFLKCVSMLGIFNDFSAAKFENVARWVVVLVGGLLVLPLVAFIRRIDRLAPISFVTATTAVIFLGAIVTEDIVCMTSLQDPILANHTLDLAPGPTGAGSGYIWLEALCEVTFAFIMQYNVLPVFRSIEMQMGGGEGGTSGESVGLMHRALRAATALGFVVYVATFLVVYVSHGVEMYDSLIYTLYGEKAGGFPVWQLGVGQLLSYPLIAYTAVKMIADDVIIFYGTPYLLMGACTRVRRHPHERTELLAEKPGDEKPGDEKPRDEKQQQVELGPAGGESGALEGFGGRLADFLCAWTREPSRLAHALAGICWVVSTVIVSIAVPDTSAVVGLVGALCATPLMTVFPPLMLLRCKSYEDEWLPRLFHIITCGLGLLLTVGGVVVAIVDWDATAPSRYDLNEALNFTSQHNSSSNLLLPRIVLQY